MKRLAVLLALAGALYLLPAAFAQEHAEVGVFADYVRLHHAGDANFWGLGGRAAFNVHSHIQFEADMAYDFEKVITTTTTTGGVVTATRSPLRLLHGTFGPKLVANAGGFQVFGFAKGGFLHFGTGNFTTAVGNVFGGDTNGVFYPGGGIAIFAGPVGLRVDAGDLIYFDRGANHNLRFTFGPQFKF
jgi:hypothetical protein